MEITAAVDSLLDVLEGIELARDEPPRFGPSYLLHGLERLDVIVHPRSGS